MDYIGIDIGSTAAKIVARGDHEMEFALPTGWSSKETANIIKERLAGDGIDVTGDGAKVVATGYGRIAVEYADYVITEITCHARGGREMGSDDCAVINVGGQDTKVILISHGVVQDFLMNDKCSAGTGKFLEIMANRLGVDLHELFDMAEGGETLSISSLCTVFAESEVISLIANNKEKADIAWGVCRAIAGKAYSLMKRVGLEETFMMTGGVAKNLGVVRAVEEKIQSRLYICPEPEIVGAAGAALYALDKMQA